MSSVTENGNFYPTLLLCLKELEALKGQVGTIIYIFFFWGGEGGSSWEGVRGEGVWCLLVLKYLLSTPDLLKLTVALLISSLFSLFFASNGEYTCYVMTVFSLN